MDAIAVTAGLSKGSIYRYFPDKQGLFRESVTTTLQHVLAAYRPLTADPELEIRRLCSLTSDTRLSAAYSLSRSPAAIGDVADAAASIIENHLTKPFADYLRQTVRDSNLSHDDALTLSRLAVTTLLNTSHLATPESEPARIAFLLRACGLQAVHPQADGF
jgi:AcrR family transcriptional regulator